MHRQPFDTGIYLTAIGLTTGGTSTAQYTFTHITCVIPEAVISLDAPDDERKYRLKHVEQPRNNKLSYTVASCWSFSYIKSRSMES